MKVPNKVDNNLKSTIDILHEAGGVDPAAKLYPEKKEFDHATDNRFNMFDNVCGSNNNRLMSLDFLRGITIAGMNKVIIQIS